jgi:tetratricopeptide (TPR) repeat protein
MSVLDRALALWRGAPYPDLDGCAVALAEAARLEELRRSAVENRLDALVASGAHASSIADLDAAVTAEPLRERRWELLMVALYRSGRQAEALRAFQRARSLLVEELGIEPGPALRQLDRAIAAQDESLGLPADLAAEVPRQVVAQVRRADGQRLAGDEYYRVTVHGAAQRAVDVGDDDALIDAALSGVRRAGARASGAVDEELVELLECALERATDDAPRAQLVSALAQEIASTADRSRLVTLSDEALAAARRTGDAAVISEVLARRTISLAGPDLLEERLQATEENMRIAPHVDDPLSWWAALFTRIAAAIEVGDIGEVEHRLAELRDVTNEIDAAPARWGLLITDAWHQLLRGRLGAAERSAMEAYEFGTATAQPDALAVYAGQMLNVRRVQGRLLELEPTIRAALDQPSVNASTRPLLAEAMADLGQHGFAGAMLREELDSSVASPPGQYRLTIICAWASVAARVDEKDAGAHLLSLLEPYLDHVCFNGAFVVGSVALFHGALARMLGDAPVADSSLQSALRKHKQLDAPLLVARTEAALAFSR